MKYKISKEAINDLKNIWIYTFENWSTEQADRYYSLLMDEIEYIAENPRSGRDYGHIREGYFRTRVKSHFIFYRIKPKVTTIEVIRILHQRMDIDEILKE